MFEQKMYTEGLKLLFVCMKNDCAFYRKAFEITGQNAFTDIIRNSLHNLFPVRDERNLYREPDEQSFSDG